MHQVSVIIPVYNASAYIERCAKSLFGQTLQDLEYVFVDDCTPDNSIKVLNEVISLYPEREEFVRIVSHKVNLGLPAARKTGLAAASGEYVIYCDSDDWVDRDMYKLMLEKAVDENADMVISGYCESDGEYTVKNHNVDNDPDIFRALIADRIPGFTCTKLIRRSLFTDDIVFPKGNLQEDTCLIIQLAGKCKHIATVDKPLYYYFQNPASICHTSLSEEKFLGARDNLLTAVSFLENNGFAAKYPSETRYLKSRITKISIQLPRPLFRKYNRHIDWNLLLSRYCPFKEKIGYVTKLLGIHGLSRMLRSK